MQNAKRGVLHLQPSGVSWKHSTSYASQLSNCMTQLTQDIGSLYLSFKCHTWAGKGFPCSLPNVGTGAHIDAYRQSARGWLWVIYPAVGCHYFSPVTYAAAKHHRPLAGTKLYCLVTESHRCKQFAQGCYADWPRVGFAPTTASPTLYPLRNRATRC